MATEAQRVVVIVDTSRDINWKAIKCVSKGLSLSFGDELTILGILCEVTNPMGYKSKVESINQKLVEEQVTKKKKEYRSNPEALEIFDLCEMEKIKFRIEVQAGTSPKVVAVNAANKLNATLVILDRQMKKHKKYFLDQLSCRISRIKHNNIIEKLRELRTIEDISMPLVEKSNVSYVTYGEMIPESVKTRVSPQKSSSSWKTENSEKEQDTKVPPHENHGKSLVSRISSSYKLSFSSSSKGISTEASSSAHNYENSSSSKSLEEEKSTSTETETSNEVEIRTKTIHLEVEEMSQDSICSGCKNRRPQVGYIKEFRYKELHAATLGFCEKNFLSEGGFGSVYKGKLKNGLSVAVKQHKDISFQGEKEFKSEVEVLSKTRHNNLVMLLGSCSEGNHRLLVYEYVCNGSLDQHLSRNKRKPLDWDRRVKIAIGTAKGLEYLHRNKIIHRDVRPNNILVTHDHNPLLGDFGLARNQLEDSDNSTSKVVGTLGYLAPEYAEYRKVSTKSDVYSFGMVLLQLITGLRPTDKIEQDKSLIEWARPLLKEKNYPDLIDPRIQDSHDMHQLFCMVQVAEKCLREDPRKRWTMKKVVDAMDRMIEGNIEDFSPAQSDEVASSKANSPISPSSQGNATGKNDDIGSDSKADESKTDTKMGRKPTSYGKPSSSSGKKGKTTTSKKQREVFYDEMVV